MDKKDADYHGEEIKQEVLSPQDLGYPSPLALDVGKYRQYVDDFDLTEERKIELLQTLWSIMTAFVKHGYGVDSLHRCIPALAEFSSAAESDELEEIAGVQQFEAGGRTIEHDRQDE